MSALLEPATARHHDGLSEFDALLRMGFVNILANLERPVIELLRGVVRLVNLALGPVSTAFRAVESHLHVLALQVMVQQPAYFENQRGAVLKPHESRSEFLHIHLLGNRPAPNAERALFVRQLGARNAGHRDRFGIAHKPQSQVEDMHADVDTCPAAGLLLQDKAGADRRSIQLRAW